MRSLKNKQNSFSEKFQKCFLNKIAFYVEDDENYNVNFIGEELTLILIKV